MIVEVMQFYTALLLLRFNALNKHDAQNAETTTQPHTQLRAYISIM